MKTKSDFAYSASRGGQHLYRDPRTGIFCTRFTVRGRAYRLSTGVRDARCAQEIAYRKYAEIFAGKTEPARRAAVAAAAPTFGELARVFLAEIVAYSGQRVSQSSARGYVNTMSRMAAATFDRPETVRIDRFSPELLKAYRAVRYAARGLDIARDKDLVLNYSLNSEQTNALSVFSTDAIKLYAARGWIMPHGVMELKAAPKLPAKKPDFIPIPEAADTMMSRLATAALEGAAVPDTERALVPSTQTAVIYELARYCSLTSKEIQNMRWSWLSPERDRIRIAGNSEFSTKRNAKDRQIPVSPERVARWITALAPAAPNEYVIRGDTETKRLDATARTANAWIKQFIPDRKKGLHELRKMATSDFLRATNGDVYRVAEIIGDDPRTMLKYYAAVLDMNVSAL